MDLVLERLQSFSLSQISAPSVTFLVHLDDRSQKTATAIYNSEYTERFIVQELCESRGGRPGLSVLTSLLVSVDVKNY